LVHDGKRNRQIADHLALSETAVHFHIENLADKVQVNDP
jgi:DNA-binding NarL/FixJ family response regulator